MKVATTTPRSTSCARVSSSSTCPTTREGSCVEGACELHAMADTVGLQEVRYGRDGAEPPAPARSTRQPVLHLRPEGVHRLLALRARVRRDPGDARADRRGSWLRLGDLGVRHLVHGVRVRLVRCLRAGLPDHGAAGEEHHRARHADPHGQDHVRVLRGRLLVRRRDEGRRARPHDAEKEGGANEGHSCVKGRFAWGYATHDERVTTPMVRESIDRSLARGLVGRGDRLHRRPVQGDCSRSTAQTRSVASRRRGAPTKRSSSCRRWCVRRSATTTSTPARGSATRRRATG